MSSKDMQASTILNFGLSITPTVCARLYVISHPYSDSFHKKNSCFVQGDAKDAIDHIPRNWPGKIKINPLRIKH